MQLIAHKVVPPSTFPAVPVSKSGKYVYRLGISVCPSMDLVAAYPILNRIASSGTNNSQHDPDASDDYLEKITDEISAPVYGDDDEETINVDVWRFSGQRVFSVAVEDENGARAEVRNVQWRNDGQIMAVLSSDGAIRLVNTFSGKVVHRFSSTPTYAAPASPTSPKTRRSIARSAPLTSKPTSTTLSYTTHFSDPASTQSLLPTATAEASVVLDDLLSLHADIASLLKSPADLPRELANIDVESFLPRLSCLPPAGFGGEDVFSTRTSVDAVFHANKKNIQNGTVEVLIAGNSDATLSVRIFDSFEVGGVDLNSATGLRKTLRFGRILSAASWPFTSEIFVVAQATDQLSLHLLGLDLRFITQNSTTLPILATKATQLHNLMRYLDQIQAQLVREVKTAFDLPMRYLRNANEDLEGQDGAGASFTTAAYHAIVTGEVSGAMKAWLNEQVGERGVRRWEKSVSDCLELVRRLISEAWCPAVERAGIVISRLSGLAGWSTRSDLDKPELGLDRKLIEGLRDTVDVMAVCGEECLREVIKEINEFSHFIKWLKWEVEASGLEDTSERLDEMRESSDHGDIMLVLDYIEKGPHESAVKKYLSPASNAVPTSPEADEDFYATFIHERNKAGLGVQSAIFDRLLKRMRGQCDRLFEQIARSLQQGILTRYLTQLGSKSTRALTDVRVIHQGQAKVSDHSLRVHVIARGKDDMVTVLHEVVKIDGNQTRAATTSLVALRLPEIEEVLDVKFVDDDYFAVLGRVSNDVLLHTRRVDAATKDEWELRHRFREGVMESGMKPARLAINGRKKRRVLGVIDEEGRGYVVFDLDSGDAEQTPAAEDAMTL